MGRRRKTRFFIALLLPTDLAELVDSWRSKFYPRGARHLSPHITVHAPFKTQNAAKLLPKIRQLFRAYPRFALRCQRPGIFEGKKNVLHLRLAPNEGLQELHLHLLELTGEKDHWGEYRPHITVAKLTDQELEEAIRQLADSETRFPFDFVADQLILFKEDRRKTWKEYPLS